MKKNFCIGLFFIIYVTKINSLSRPLYLNEEKCIFNDFFIKSNIIITFNITEDNLTLSENLSNKTLFIINIYNRKKNTLIKSYEVKKTLGKFAFNVEKTGHYKTCIKSNIKEIFNKKDFIIFDLKTESNLDVINNTNETANLKDFEKVNQKLSFLTDKVEQIENMQLLAKSVENNFSRTQIQSTKKIAFLTIIQIIIISIVGSYNVYAIKKAFNNKIEIKK